MDNDYKHILKGLLVCLFFTMFVKEIPDIKVTIIIGDYLTLFSHTVKW